MALEGDEGSASRPGCSLPPGKTQYPLYRRLGGPQGRSGQVRKISPPPGFDPWTIQPIGSLYTDYATQPTLHTVVSSNSHTSIPSPTTVGQENLVKGKCLYPSPIVAWLSVPLCSSGWCSLSTMSVTTITECFIGHHARRVHGRKNTASLLYHAVC